MRATFNVDVAPPPEAQVPETPEPEPEEPDPLLKPDPEVPLPDSDNPYVEQPPEAAEAGKLLTAEPDPEQSVPTAAAPADESSEEPDPRSGSRDAAKLLRRSRRRAARSPTQDGGESSGGRCIAADCVAFPAA